MDNLFQVIGIFLAGMFAGAVNSAAGCGSLISFPTLVAFGLPAITANATNTDLPPEVLRTFRFLKSLPDDYQVWHRLTPWEQDAPDFLVLHPEKRALLVKASTQNDRNSRPAAQMLLMTDNRAVLGEAQPLR